MEKWIYDIKCRRCGKITEIYFGSQDTTPQKAFISWVLEHCTYPVTKQCECHNGKMGFHDLISYNIKIN